MRNDVVTQYEAQLASPLMLFITSSSPLSCYASQRVVPPMRVHTCDRRSQMLPLWLRAMEPSLRGRGQSPVWKQLESPDEGACVARDLQIEHELVHEALPLNGP